MADDDGSGIHLGGQVTAEIMWAMFKAPGYLVHRALKGRRASWYDWDVAFWGLIVWGVVAIVLGVGLKAMAWWG